MSAEILHTCPSCGRGNFTTRGLRTHRCERVPDRATPQVSGLRPHPSSSAMPKAPAKPSSKLVVLSPKKPVDLDKLDGAQIGNNFRFDLADHGKRAAAMIAHVEGLKVERSKKAILAGLYLAQVKAVLGHGPFEKWATKHLGKSSRTARNYMALAAIFCRKQKVLPPEIVGANQLSLDLSAHGNDEKAFVEKLAKFVGEEGLTKLMQKHEVLSLPVPKGPPAAAHQARIEQTSEDDKASEFIASARARALETLIALNELEERWQLLTDEQLRLTLKDCDKLSTEIRAWLDTVPARRATFDARRHLDGSAERELAARHTEGSTLASLASAV